MTDLADILTRQADQVLPASDLDDVHRRVRRRRHRARTVQAAGVVLALASAAGVIQAVRPTRQHPALVIPPEVSIETVGALVLTGPGADGGPPHGFIERVDSSASEGARSIVLRPDDGRLGSGSIVITAGDDPIAHTPAPSPPASDTISTVLEGRDGQLTVRATGIPPKDVADIARNAGTVDGEPSVRLPGHLSTYRVVSAATTRPPIIREARYGCDELGEATLGGLCFTGLATAAGFEDALYAVGFAPGPMVKGQPTVYSRSIIASGVLAWEPQPGVIAFVGYSGAGNADDAATALARLAERTTIIDSAKWRSLDPQAGGQTNSWR